MWRRYTHILYVALWRMYVYSLHFCTNMCRIRVCVYWAIPNRVLEKISVLCLWEFFDNLCSFWWNSSDYSHTIKFGVKSSKKSETEFVKFMYEKKTLKKSFLTNTALKNKSSREIPGDI